MPQLKFVVSSVEPHWVRVRYLLSRIKRSRHNTRFDDLCKLVEAAGIPLKRRSSSHRIYEDVNRGIFLNLQPGSGGKAKGYQVRQVIQEIEDHVLEKFSIREEESDE